MRLIDADKLKENLLDLKVDGDRKVDKVVQMAINELFPQIIDDQPTCSLWTPAKEPPKEGQRVALIVAKIVPYTKEAKSFELVLGTYRKGGYYKNGLVASEWIGVDEVPVAWSSIEEVMKGADLYEADED